jgi:hypothetical protein
MTRGAPSRKSSERASLPAHSSEKADNSYLLHRGLARITDLPGFYVLAVDHEVTDRGW